MATPYTDIDLSFKKHPLNGDVPKLSGRRAIKQSIQNLVGYRAFEKPGKYHLDSGIQSILFSTDGKPAISQSINVRVKFIIEQYEPRVELIKVDTVSDKYTFSVNITLRLLNESDAFDIKIFLPVR
jgi:phage baseplate assembly protein W